MQLCGEHKSTVLVVDNLFECHTLNSAAKVSQAKVNNVRQLLYSVQNVKAAYKLSEIDMLWRYTHQAKNYFENMQYYSKIVPLPDGTSPNSKCIDYEILQKINQLSLKCVDFDTFDFHQHIIVSFGTASIPLSNLKRRLDWIFKNLQARTVTLLCGGSRLLETYALEISKTRVSNTRFDIVLQADPTNYMGAEGSLFVCHGGLNSIREAIMNECYVLVLGIFDTARHPDEYERNENGLILTRLGVGSLQTVH